MICTVMHVHGWTRHSCWYRGLSIGCRTTSTLCTTHEPSSSCRWWPLLSFSASGPASSLIHSPPLGLLRYSQPLHRSSAPSADTPPSATPAGGGLRAAVADGAIARVVSDGPDVRHPVGSPLGSVSRSHRIVSDHSSKVGSGPVQRRMTELHDLREILMIMS
jgi:hypothetical protein